MTFNRLHNTLRLMRYDLRKADLLFGPIMCGKHDEILMGLRAASRYNITNSKGHVATYKSPPAISIIALLSSSQSGSLHA